MKIGLDLRFIENDLYSEFVIELIEILTYTDQENHYVIYTNSKWEIEETNNTTIKYVWIENGSLKEQFHFLKVLKKDNNNIMIFFNHYKPLWYKGEYYLIVPSLKDVYYSNFSSLIEKYKNVFLLEKNLKNASKVICFDDNTKSELIERFNIKEEKINILPAFFKQYAKKDVNTLQVDVKTKYQIWNDFFVYSGWEWIEKNLEKLIYVFEKLKNTKDLHLIFIWDEVSKNIPLRNLVVQYTIKDRVKFLWDIKDSDKHFIYKQSKGAIFPSLYETFPFHMAEPLHFDTPILASNFKSIKNIFWDTIEYFSPISKSSILTSIDTFIDKKNKKIDYKNIKNTYTRENTVQSLLEIIK